MTRTTVHTPCILTGFNFVYFPWSPTDGLLQTSRSVRHNHGKGQTQTPGVFWSVDSFNYSKELEDSLHSQTTRWIRHPVWARTVRGAVSLECTNSWCCTKLDGSWICTAVWIWTHCQQKALKFVSFQTLVVLFMFATPTADISWNPLLLFGPQWTPLVIYGTVLITECRIVLSAGNTWRDCKLLDLNHFSPILGGTVCLMQCIHCVMTHWCCGSE